MTVAGDIAAVVIGRNEGARLIACLDALQGQAGRLVYVDSGSTDGSQDAAHARGADVVALDMDQPFTAARARNAGLDRLRDEAAPVYVQFLDGDCRLQPGWIATARTFLEANPKAAVACGRRREQFPDSSAYNRLIDAEWDTPVGRARSCGGDALMRMDALDAVGGYNPALIAGEEPELCVRLRAQGWQIWRLNAEMTLHDAALTRFGQWWQRTRRGGYAFAEGVALHGGPPERHCVAPLRRIVVWGLVLPAVTLPGALVTPWALVLLLAWPAQVVRLHLRGMGWQRAAFMTLTKLPEAQGALTYWWRRLTGAGARLIEYK
jgi:GT2 family glycosyltransferase